MTKVVIIGDMTLGETTPPPGLGGPVDPGYGVRPGVGGGRPTHPIELPPGSPDQGLPPIPGQGLPPPDLEVDEIWPPLKPGEPTPKKVYAIVAIPGVGYRYTVVNLSHRPDQGLPGRPGRPEKPEVDPPGHPDQGLPPEREPKHR